MDPLLLRQLILQDLSLIFAERQTLLEQLRLAESAGPSVPFDVARLTSMGLGALAGYVLSKISGASSMGRLAMGALGAVAGGLLAPQPDPGIGFGRGYYFLQ